jgi:uncharacterized OB-fold protein
MFPARYWREIPQRYRLEASRCTACGAIWFPPRAICPSCRARAFETVRLPLRGTLLTYTVQHVATSDYADLQPFAVGIVELDGGVRLTAQVVDIEAADLRPGLPVRLEFRRLFSHGDHGVHCYGYKAVPVG